MQSLYSNYDSDGFLSGSRNRVGGLNPNQEFRPQPQRVGNGAGLLVSVLTDVPGRVSIDFTNIIEEPYAFVEEYQITSDEFTTNQTVSKTYLVSVKATNFRIRFRNISSLKQNKLKLFTFILPSSPVVSINPDTLQDVFINTKIFDSLGNNLTSTNNALNTNISGQIVDISGQTVNIKDTSGNLITSNSGALNINLRDGSSNLITSYQPTTDTNIRALHVTNINNFETFTLNFTIIGLIISSNIINLGRYKNFDIIFENISATNLSPVRFYLYVSRDGVNFILTDIYIDIFFGMTNAYLNNITINENFIRLEGTYITGLNIANDTTFVCVKE